MLTRFIAALVPPASSFSFFFFNDTATTEIYTLSLHDALPISNGPRTVPVRSAAIRRGIPGSVPVSLCKRTSCERSEEHTSELQSPCNLVCRLLLEKKNHNSSADKPSGLVQRMNYFNDPSETLP